MTTRRTPKKGTSQALASIRKMLETLPSKSEREELRNAAAELADFFLELQSLLAQVPSLEDAAAASRALQRLADALDRRRGNRAVTALLGARSRPTQRTFPAPTEDDSRTAKALIAELRSMPGDSIRERLTDKENFPVRLLVALSNELGLRISSRPVRDAIIQQIATSIVNQRGYQSLRST